MTNESISKLVAEWQSNNLVRPGASESELDDFEEFCGVKLPDAFRYLYSIADGMDFTMDSRLFDLWSLDRIRENKGVVKNAGTTRICFGDFLIDSHRYYLVSRPAGDELVVVDEPDETVALSFAEFGVLMLTDPEKLRLASPGSLD
jgi:SMI1/KNR4 family protein SUKH-1